MAKKTKARRKFKKKLWTKAEEDIVKNCIMLDPGNLDRSFETAARMLVDRTKNSVKRKWYGNGNHGQNIYSSGLRFQNKIFFIQNQLSPNKLGNIHYPNSKNIMRRFTVVHLQHIMSIQP